MKYFIVVTAIFLTIPFTAIINTADARLDETYIKDQKACLDSGGKWVLAPTACYTFCKKPDNCEEAFTWGCDCGDQKCWNGTQCQTKTKKEKSE